MQDWIIVLVLLTATLKQLPIFQKTLVLLDCQIFTMKY